MQKVTPSATTNYIYDGANIFEELDQNNNVPAKYTQDLGVDQPLAETRGGVNSFYHQDGLGSVTSLSNSSGALANWYGYDSFGNSTGTSGTVVNPFQYTGREFLDQQSGLYYYRARYYDAQTGRFISEDPVGFDAGINFYSFARNNPIKFNDPLGMDVWLEGPSGNEPQGHMSINVGDPGGQYDSYSFGVNGDPWLGGEVYKDTTLGGEILSDYYLKTSPEEDARVHDILEQLVGQKAPYRPWRTCRTFSQDQFDKIKRLGIGTPAIAPIRPTAPGTKPWTVPSTASTLAWDKLNAQVVLWLTRVSPMGLR